MSDRFFLIQDYDQEDDVKRREFTRSASRPSAAEETRTGGESGVRGCSTEALDKILPMPQYKGKRLRQWQATDAVYKTLLYGGPEADQLIAEAKEAIKAARLRESKATFDGAD